MSSPSLRRYRRLALGATVLVAPLVARVVAAQAPAAPHDHVAPVVSTRPRGPDSATVERELARLRGRLRSLRDLETAAAAGYSREVPACVAHPRDGGMGFHHENASLLDGRLEPDRPEILVFGRAADGSYRLNGVEYVVPYSSHPRDQAPPHILGQSLRRADALRLWYLHVWLWEDNPLGVFAAWNPKVTCPDR
jgi:hypothetical protein